MVATEIKYTAGDEVYWLSSRGFKKGIIKSVMFIDTISISNKKRSKRKEVKFLLWCEDFADVYMGDEIDSSEIFPSYKEMLAFYSNKKI